MHEHLKMHQTSISFRKFAQCLVDFVPKFVALSFFPMRCVGLFYIFDNFIKKKVFGIELKIQNFFPCIFTTIRDMLLENIYS